MALTHTAILKASATETAYKLADGGGLHLLVQPGGSKLWRFRYRFGGKENMLALGAFPEVSLAAARTKRDDARKLLSAGTDPSAQRKLDKVAAAVAAANTFGAIVAEYLTRLGALLPPVVQHPAAITDEVQLGALMTAIDEYDGWPTIRAALFLLAFTMTRPGDVRHMQILFCRQFTHRRKRSPKMQ